MAGVQGTPGQMRRPLRSWSGWQTSSPRRQQPGWRRRSGKLFLALWALLQVLPCSQGAGKAVSGRCFCQVHFGAGGLSHCAQHSLTHKLWHKIWHVVTHSGSISCVSGAAFNRYDGETAPRTLGSFTLAMRHSSCSHLRSGLCEPIVLGILLRCSSDSMRYLAGDHILAGYLGSMQPRPAAGRQGFSPCYGRLGIPGVQDEPMIDMIWYNRYDRADE